MHGHKAPSRFAIGALLAAMLATPGCSRLSRSAPETAAAIRLVDVFKPEFVSGGSGTSARAIPRTEWRFDGAAPAPPLKAFTQTRGWEAGPGVAGLTVRGGRLVGRSTDDLPLLHVERTTGLDNHDQLHAIEVRMRVSAGTQVWVSAAREEKVNLEEQRKQMRGSPFVMTAQLVPGNEMQTYTLTTALHASGSELRHLLVRPTDVAAATFEIESIRLVFRKEYLAGIPSGVAWQGLKEIYRESVAARAAETIGFTVTLPERPWLDLAVGTLEDAPVTFRVSVARAGAADGAPLLEHTVTTPHRWDDRPIDLERYAGQTVRLSMSLSSPEKDALGFWGSPVIRNRSTPAAASSRDGASTPRGVILIQADTLRRDHLDAYGYKRETAPTLRGLASEGVLFNNYTVQATWTKVSTPSLMTSLYPTSHGVADFHDHLPAAANTLAESYRAAGYATVSFASVLFTGQFTNLHQGFEELHEDGSISTPGSSKTAREFVDRLQSWLERHKDGPFFAFLHVFDPHDPYEPYRPYDSLWADPSRKEEHDRQSKDVRKFIQEPLRQLFGMPSRDELIAAKFDPETYVAHDRDWYDGSIRAMDVEIARLVQTLRRLGLDENTLIVFLSDHGEEFHEHGRMFHGQSVYGELSRVPLLMRWPAGLPKGKVVDEVVQSLDVMPTLLEMSGVSAPDGIQGQSLTPLLVHTGNGSDPVEWRPRPAITEKAVTSSARVGAPPPNDTESYSITDGQWKLIHNTARPRGGPEFELYDFVKDPLDTTDVASQHPDVVARLAKALDGWKQTALAARLKPDAEGVKNLSPEQLQRLRSLGYIR
jgi:arylsulfatase A-like enzyme